MSWIQPLFFTFSTAILVKTASFLVHTAVASQVDCLLLLMHSWCLTKWLFHQSCCSVENSRMVPSKEYKLRSYHNWQAPTRNASFLAALQASLSAVPRRYQACSLPHWAFVFALLLPEVLFFHTDAWLAPRYPSGLNSKASLSKISILWPTLHITLPCFIFFF